MPFTLEALATEIETDPTGIGYSSMTAVQVTDALNLSRAAIIFPRPDVTPLEILEAINVQDFVASGQQTILHGSWFESLTQYPSIRILKSDGTDTRVLTNIMRLLTNASASETRIRALASRTGSRAEQLWGMGTVVTVEQVRGTGRA